MANTIELMVLVHIPTCCVASFVTYYGTYGIQKFKKAKKLHFKLKLEAGEPGGSNINRVSNKSRGLTALF